MSETNNTALVPVTPGPVQTQPLSGDAAVTSSHLPANIAYAFQKSSPYQPGEPPRLLANGKTNPAYLDYVTEQHCGPSLESLPERYGASNHAITYSLDLLNGLIANPVAGARKFVEELKATKPEAVVELAKALGSPAPEAAERVRNLSSQYEQAHWRELQKWTPRSDEASNDRLRYAALQGAYAELISDPHYQAIHNRAVALLLNGQDDGGLVAEFNRALGQVILDYIRTFEGR